MNKKINKVIVYSAGDSKSLKTWSNVPYFFTCELEKRGIEVIRKDISFSNISNFFLKIYYYCTKIIRIIIQKIYCTKTIWKYKYTDLYISRINKIIENTQKEYRDADFQVIFNFAYGIKSKIPLVMIGDWTINYRLSNKYKRKPLNFEQKLIDKQHQTMNNADAIISIMPESYKEIKQIFPNKTYYFGHIVNSLEEYKPKNKEEIESNHILFIGKKDNYQNGLKDLIEIINLYNSKHNKIVLDVIGMKKEDVDTAHDVSFCNFYGYLNKDFFDEKEQYYKLIKNAKCVINITKNWNGMSSLFESLYLGTPIICSDNIEAESLLSNIGHCCTIVKDDNYENIINIIYEIMNMGKEEYKTISKKCHMFADAYTWDKFIDKFIKMCETIKK